MSRLEYSNKGKYVKLESDECAPILEKEKVKNQKKYKSMILDDPNYNHIMKILLLGDANTGKSALLKKYVSGEFPQFPYISTIGVDFDSKVINIDNSESKIKFLFKSANSESFSINNNSNTNQNDSETSKFVVETPEYIPIKLQIWDTAGQERFRSITQSYYKSTRLCVLCFDSTANSIEGTLNQLKKWLSEIKKYAGAKTHVYILGNKLDDMRGSLLLSDIDKNKDGGHEFESRITELQNYENLNVKFIGWCSALDDVYVRNLKDYKSDDPNKKYNIKNIFADVMYDFMVCESKLGNNSSLKIYDYNFYTDKKRLLNNRGINEYGVDQKKCCTIL